MTVLAIAIKGGDFVREGEIVKIEYVEKIEDNYTGYLVTTDEHINKRFAKGNWRLEIIQQTVIADMGRKREEGERSPS